MSVKGKKMGFFLERWVFQSGPLLLLLLPDSLLGNHELSLSLLLTSMSSRRKPRASLPASKVRFSPPPSPPPSPADDDFLLLFDDEEEGSWPTDCFFDL